MVPILYTLPHAPVDFSSYTYTVEPGRAIYKVCDLIGHFILASQGLLGHCTFVMEIMS